MAKVISKTVASEVATKMVKDIDKKIKEKELEMALFFKSIYYGEVLGWDLVKELDDVNQNFIKKVDYFRVMCEGKSKIVSIQMKEYLYCGGSNNYTLIPEQAMSELIKREGSIELLKSKRKEVRTKVYETLIGLNSIKRIKDIFPEAYAYIPVEEERNLPAVINNVSTLVGEINSICNG